MQQQQYAAVAALAKRWTIYVGSYDGALYAIAPDGKVKWKLGTADKIHGAPGVATDGAIVVGSQDDHVYCVNPDGSLRWSLALGGDVDPTPAIARYGTMYVAADDGKLHAFQDERYG